MFQDKLWPKVHARVRTPGRVVIYIRVREKWSPGGGNGGQAARCGTVCTPHNPGFPGWRNPQTTLQSCMFNWHPAQHRLEKPGPVWADVTVSA